MNRSNNSKSLQWQIFIRIAPVATLVLLAVIVINSYRVSQALHQEIQGRVGESAINAARQTDIRLKMVIEASNAVAQNDMVVNGIVDLEHRNSTLQSYFRSLKLPGPNSQKVTMTDYRGRVLASTTPDVKDFGTATWFSDVISGKRFVGTVNQTLTVAIPVLYSNRAEGVVVTTFAIDDFLADQSAVSKSSVLVFHDAESVIYTTEHGSAFSSSTLEASPGWLIATADVAGLPNLKVSFLESEESALHASNAVAKSQLVQMIVLIVGLLAVIWLASRLATKPLKQLLKQIALIQDTGNLALRVPDVGPREFVELGSGINAMLGELQRTTVSQEEYRLSEERLAIAIQGSNDGLWDWDIESDIVWYASRFKELLGYRDCESDFPNTLASFRDHLHPEDAEATWECVTNHLEKELDYDVEYRLKRRQGDYRWFRARGAAVRDQSGKAIRMSGSIQDIADRKRFEHAMKQSNKDLEQFAYIASHDLQEPLRKVASFCGLIGEQYGEQLGEDGMRYVDFAIDGATRMRALVQDLLKYSRIGSEKDRNRKIQSDHALKSALLNLELAIEESKAVITHDELPLVLAEESELAQLFQNLIGNAIKYRAENTPEIHIGVESQATHWKFAISDNGIGVAPEYREQVFGVFKRLHTRNEYSGTGIGLAICKRIVEQLRGEIWFETKTEPGCRICFTVRKQKTAVPIRQPGEPSQNAGEGSAPTSS